MLDVLGYIYQEIVKARNAFYDRGLIEAHDLGARVISVGNITTGGTGKTPLVAYIAELLAERGEKVCILTRGYGRENARARVLVSDGENVLEDDPSKTGDEPLELAKRLKGRAIIIADADRVAAAEWAKRKFGVTVFLLDDAFQHRKAKRDVDIVCIDATWPLDEMRMLPGGRLREPLSGLTRAGAIVVTRADLVDDTSISNLRSEISRFAPATRIFEASTRIAGYFDGSAEREQLDSERAFAFCGIGNPDGFFGSLRLAGVDVAGFEIFADHYRYSQRDIDALANKASRAGAAMLVTTAKDAVKLSALKFDIPCLVAKMEVVIDDADEFARLI